MIKICVWGGGKENGFLAAYGVSSQKFNKETGFLSRRDGVKSGWYSLPRVWLWMKSDRPKLDPNTSLLNLTQRPPSVGNCHSIQTPMGDYWAVLKNAL